MKVFIHKKPVRLSLSRLCSLLLGFGAILIFVQSLEMRFVVFYGGASVLVLVFLASLVAPYVSGLVLENGRVEQATGLGGLIVVAVDDLDLERSALSPVGLHLVPNSGETLFVSAMEYGREDILRIAHYAGLSQSGWAQEV